MPTLIKMDFVFNAGFAEVRSVMHARGGEHLFVHEILCARLTSHTTYAMWT